MKRVILMLMAVIAFSLSAWCQSSVIIPMGNEILTKNSLMSAKQIFKNEHMSLDMLSSTHGVYMDDLSRDFSLLVSVDANRNGTIKEVSFLCGAMYCLGLEEELSKINYKLIKSGKTTLENGASVPQKIYSNGTKRCYVRTLDNAMLQIIFKRQVSQSQKK